MIENTITKSIWLETLSRMFRSKLNVAAAVIVLLYIMVALLSHFGIIAKDWNIEVGKSYEVPSISHWFGTDIFGYSVLKKVIKSTEIAMSVGFVVGIIAIFYRNNFGMPGGLLWWFYRRMYCLDL